MNETDKILTVQVIQHTTVAIRHNRKTLEVTNILQHTVANEQNATK